MQEIKDHCDVTPKIVLVGNKLDLINEKAQNRAVKFDEAITFANENGMVYIEASALTCKNVNEAFNKLFMSKIRRYPQKRQETWRRG